MVVGRFATDDDLAGVAAVAGRGSMLTPPGPGVAGRFLVGSGLRRLLSLGFAICSSLEIELASWLHTGILSAITIHVCLSSAY